MVKITNVSTGQSQTDIVYVHTAISIDVDVVDVVEQHRDVVVLKLTTATDSLPFMDTRRSDHECIEPALPYIYPSPPEIHYAGLKYVYLLALPRNSMM